MEDNRKGALSALLLGFIIGQILYHFYPPQRVFEWTQPWHGSGVRYGVTTGRANENFAPLVPHDVHWHMHTMPGEYVTR